MFDLKATLKHHHERVKCHGFNYCQHFRSIIVPPNCDPEIHSVANSVNRDIHNISRQITGVKTIEEYQERYVQLFNQTLKKHIDHCEC